uniref:PDZ domain-containing protein n=1 Tax=Strongyloides stercoralis TaxID=6248 RepID=A0A0K0EKF9_STRER
MEEEISIRMTRSSPNIPWGVGFRQNGSEVVVDFLDKGSIAEKAGLNKTDRLIEFQHSSLRSPDAYAISRDLERLLDVSMKLKRFVSFPQGIPWNLDGNERGIQYQSFNEGHNAFHSTDRFQTLGRDNYSYGQNYNNPNNTGYQNYRNSNNIDSSYSYDNYNRDSSFNERKHYSTETRSTASSPYSGYHEPYHYNPRNYSNVSPEARLSHLSNYNTSQPNDYGHIIHHHIPQSDCFKRISKAVGTPCH